jgi:glucose-1-phosphate cytidylyltransferase
MKVVLFAGGLGTRLRDHDEKFPKPMVSIGYRPIMWHLMKYYAYYGHTDFIVCLGYKADVIKQYFLGYDECLSNNFVMAQGGKQVELLKSDIQDWRITFVDTGLFTPIGERLRRVRQFVAGEEMFLANYTDCLTDMDLGAYLERFRVSEKVAAMITVPPNVSFHYVASQNGLVTSLTDAKSTPLRVNGGFFAFRQGIFEFLEKGDELVDGPFHRLMEREQLLAYEHDGFWRAMDTFKDKEQLEALHAGGSPPWEIWAS